MAEKKPVDIEKLLQWAYVDELSKRATSSAEGIWSYIEEWGQRGGVDPGHGAAQRYPHFGLPHPDAEKIEKAVNALPRLAIDWHLSREALMGDLLPIFNMRDTLLVRTLHTAAMVMSHAIKKTRPDWREESPHPVFVPAERGRNRAKIVGTCLAKDYYSQGAYCPVRWEPSPIDIALVRADYVCWHRGLTTLAKTLELEAHVALPPSAPEAPWFESEERAGRVLAVGERGQTMKPLPLKPDRPRARRYVAPKKVEEGA